MTLKQFKSKYKCIVNPHKRKVYNLKRKKQEKYSQPGERNGHQKMMPMIGFGSGCCDTFNNYDKIYLTEDGLIHESCAIQKYNLT